MAGAGNYFSVTFLLAEPPRLLRTVMFPGLLGQENSPLPSESVPMSSSVEVTYTRSVAPELELDASTRSSRLLLVYSALLIVTVSVLLDGAVTVRVADRVVPP